MELGTIKSISMEAMYVLILVSSPILLTALVVGVVISLFQALTQIQENTLSFVPKILIIYLGLIIFAPYMANKMSVFLDHIIQSIVIS